MCLHSKQERNYFYGGSLLKRADNQKNIASRGGPNGKNISSVQIESALEHGQHFREIYSLIELPAGQKESHKNENPPYCCKNPFCPIFSNELEKNAK